MDWLSYIMGFAANRSPPSERSKHFRKAEQPQGASDRCLDCAVEVTCPYSAKRIYLTALERGHTGWPTSVLTPDVYLRERIGGAEHRPLRALRLRCDNDVVDNQVVAMQFAGGRTASSR
jgi:hypothetical protein